MGHQRISKCFITGVTPLSMADHTSGFNIATNVSDSRKLSGLCGLSYDDVLAALQLPGMCNENADVEKHLQTMRHYFNGYRFSPHADVPRVFNTNTCLEYLQVSCRRNDVFVSISWMLTNYVTFS